MTEICPCCRQPMPEGAERVMIHPRMMSARLYHCLTNEGYTHLSQLERVSARKILQIPNLGMGSARELAHVMMANDMKLGQWASPDNFNARYYRKWEDEYNSAAAAND